MAIKFTPTQDRVLVKRIDEAKTTASGIVIPDSASEKPSTGKVIAVGAGKILDNGNRSEMEVKVNDTVIFSKYAGTEIKLDGESYSVMKEDDIMGIL